MSGWRTTLILVLLGAGLGTWVWLDLRKRSVLDEGSFAYPILKDLPDKDVTRIELDRSTKADPAKRERIVIEKQGKNWVLLEPVQGPAAPLLVAQLIDQLCGNWANEYLPAEGNLEKFGLGPNALRVKLFHPQGQPVVLIGRSAALKDSIYAMQEGAAKVALMEHGFEQPFRAPLEEFQAQSAKVPSVNFPMPDPAALD